VLLWGSREVLEIASFPRMAACGVRNTLKFRQPHVLYNFRNLFWRRPGHIDSDLSASRSSRLLRGVTSAAAEDRENGNCPAKSRYPASVSLIMMMAVQVSISLQTWFFV
jgi:hypothetical protein